jgi:type II secretory pathway pseudopilin PulG
MRPLARTRGLSLLEVAVAVSVMSVAFMGLFTSLASSSALSAASSEDVLALQCAQNQLEAMKATPFGNVFAYYYAPAGKVFPVSGLGPHASGRVTFLSEQSYGAITGKPVDLDFDGSTVGTTPTASYAYFPVQVTITWRSRSNRAATSPPRTLTLTSAIFNVPAHP